jgi:hypothetical protein
MYIFVIVDAYLVESSFVGEKFRDLGACNSYKELDAGYRTLFR